MNVTLQKDNFAAKQIYAIRQISKSIELHFRFNRFDVRPFYSVYGIHPLRFRIRSQETGLQFPIFFDAVVAAIPPEPPAVEIDSVKDIATIIYTGGTTGVPKGAALTHANIVFNVTALDQGMWIPHEKGATPQQLKRGGANCFLGVLPMYHVSAATL